MTRLRLLIFYPGKESYIGLWLPDMATSWVTYSVVQGNQSGPSLLAVVETALREQRLTLASLTHIGAMEGPASYTHLRVFLATANALAWAQHLPLFGFGPDASLPDDLPELYRTAKLNIPIEPVYPSAL